MNQRQIDGWINLIVLIGLFVSVCFAAGTAWAFVTLFGLAFYKMALFPQG